MHTRPVLTEPVRTSLRARVCAHESVPMSLCARGPKSHTHDPAGHLRRRLSHRHAERRLALHTYRIENRARARIQRGSECGKALPHAARARGTLRIPKPGNLARTKSHLPVDFFGNLARTNPPRLWTSSATLPARIRHACGLLRQPCPHDLCTPGEALTQQGQPGPVPARARTASVR